MYTMVIEIPFLEDDTIFCHTFTRSGIFLDTTQEFEEEMLEEVISTLSGNEDSHYVDMVCELEDVAMEFDVTEGKIYLLDLRVRGAGRIRAEHSAHAATLLEVVNYKCEHCKAETREAAPAN